MPSNASAPAATPAAVVAAERRKLDPPPADARPSDGRRDEEEKERFRLQRFYWKEAIRCQDAKAYLAGCVMLGSAL